MNLTGAFIVSRGRRCLSCSGQTLRASHQHRFRAWQRSPAAFWCLFGRVRQRLQPSQECLRWRLPAAGILVNCVAPTAIEGGMSDEYEFERDRLIAQDPARPLRPGQKRSLRSWPSSPARRMSPSRPEPCSTCRECAPHGDCGGEQADSILVPHRCCEGGLTIINPAHLDRRQPDRLGTGLSDWPRSRSSSCRSRARCWLVYWSTGASLPPRAWASALYIFLGFLLGAVPAVVLGLFMARLRWVEKAIYPLVHLHPNDAPDIHRTVADRLVRVRFNTPRFCWQA